MGGWGLEQWGLEPWAGCEVPEELLGTDAPVITLLNPTSGATGVSPGEVVTLSILDANSNLDPASVVVTANGEPVYSFAAGFDPAYAGTSTSVSQGVVLQFLRNQRWAYGQSVILRVEAADTDPTTTQRVFRWTIQDDPRCYTAIDPEPIERKIILPNSVYIRGERIRQQLIRVSLREQPVSIRNRDLKAARVILQMAWATELRTLLNQRVTVEPDVLAVTVCERERDLTISNALRPYHADAKALIEELFSRGAVPQHYIRTLSDYLSSNRYPYQVSLMATLVVLVKTLEP